METQDDRHTGMPSQVDAAGATLRETSGTTAAAPPDDPPPDWSATEKDLWRAFRAGADLDLCPGWRRLRPSQDQRQARLAMLPSGASLADRSAGLGAEFGARSRRQHTYLPRESVSPATVSNGGLYYTAARNWWHAQSKVRAEVVRRLLLDGPPAEPGHIRRLLADGLRVEGRLDLQDAEIATPIELRNCDFSEPVDLSHARLSRVSLTSSKVPGLTAVGIRVDGPFDLAETTVEDGIRLAGGEIAGRLDLTKAVLGKPVGRPTATDGEDAQPPRRVLLNARHVRVGGETILEGAIIAGDVDLTFAGIGGDLSLGAARIVGQLLAGSAEITGSVCTTTVGDANSPMEIDGTLDLSTSVIHKSVVLPESRLSGQDTWALNLSSATVDESVRLERASISGGLNVFNTVIGEDLSIVDAMITAPGGAPPGRALAVYAYGVKVDHDVDAHRAAVEGCFLIDNCAVAGNVNLNGAALRNPGGLALAAINCTAGSLQTDESQPLLVEGDIVMDGSRFERTVSLPGLRITQTEPDRRGEGEVAGTPSPPTAAEPEPTAAEPEPLAAGQEPTGAEPPPSPTGGALRAQGLVTGQLFLTRATADGPVDLRNAQIGGDLLLYAAQTTRLTLDGVAVTGSVYAHLLTAAELSGHGLKVGGDLILVGSKLRAEQGTTALYLGHSTVGGSLLAHTWRDETDTLHTCEIFGGVHLGGAQVERAVDFSSATVDAGAAPADQRDVVAFNADNYAFKSLSLRDAKVSGEIALIAGQVALDVDLAGTRLTARGTTNAALSISSCTATRLFLNLDPASTGTVALRDTQVDRVDFDEWGWPQERRLELDSFSFQWWRTVETPTPPPDGGKDPVPRSGGGRRRDRELEEKRLVARIALLDRIAFSPWAYERLAQFYRGQGKQREAERVLYARLLRFYRRQPFLARQWGNLQRIFSGYGYRSQHAVLWFVGALLAGTAYFTAHPLTDSTNTDNTVVFDPLLYTLDRMIPLVDLGQENAWNVSSWLGDKGVSTVLMVLGWVLTATVIAGAGRVIRRA